MTWKAVDEFRSGIMAEMNSGDNNQHVSLCYFTNDVDYIVFTVASHDTDAGYTYWAQWDDKEQAVADYNNEQAKLF